MREPRQDDKEDAVTVSKRPLDPASVVEMHRAGYTFEEIGRVAGLSGAWVGRMWRSATNSPALPRSELFARRYGSQIEKVLRDVGSASEVCRAFPDLPETAIRRLINEQFPHLLTRGLTARAGARAWSDDELLTAVRSAAGQRPLSINGYRRWRSLRSDAPEVNTLVRRFGSWSEVCRHAGVATMDAERNRVRESGWTNAEMAAYLHAYLAAAEAALEPVTRAGYRAWVHGHPGAPSGELLQVRFGSWSAALRAARAVSGA